MSIDLTKGIGDQSLYNLKKANILNSIFPLPKSAINHDFNANV